jgi:hypothetical protein
MRSADGSIMRYSSRGQQESMRVRIDVSNVIGKDIKDVDATGGIG